MEQKDGKWTAKERISVFSHQCRIKGGATGTVWVGVYLESKVERDQDDAVYERTRACGFFLIAIGFGLMLLASLARRR